MRRAQSRCLVRSFVADSLTSLSPLLMEPVVAAVRALQAADAQADSAAAVGVEPDTHPILDAVQAANARFESQTHTAFENTRGGDHWGECKSTDA